MRIFLCSALILCFSQGKEAFALFWIFGNTCPLHIQVSPAIPNGTIMRIFLCSALILCFSQGKDAFALLCIFDSVCLVDT